MKKIIIVFLIIFSFSSCSGKSLSSSTPISDTEILEIFDCAEKYQSNTMMFFNDDNGSFVSKDGETPMQYYNNYSKFFTKEFTDNAFDLYGTKYLYDNSKYTTLKMLWFGFTEEDIIYRVNNHGDSFDNYVKLDLNNLNQFLDYDGIMIGGEERGDDLSLIDNELRITQKDNNSITLTMTVWHREPPDYEFKINEDYVYHLENGKLIIDGLFGGFTETREFIVIENELTGKVAENITEESSPNFLVDYEYHMILEDGNWKLTDFPIWN